MKEVRPSLVKMCSVVKAELYYGAERSVNPDKTRALLESFLNQYESLPFDDAAARSMAGSAPALRDVACRLAPTI